MRKKKAVVDMVDIREKMVSSFFSEEQADWLIENHPNLARLVMPPPGDYVDRWLPQEL